MTIATASATADGPDVTPGTVPPLVSVTFPRSVPVTACAKAGRGSAQSPQASASAAASRVGYDIQSSPEQSVRIRSRGDSTVPPSVKQFE